jgi:uncharacterized protein YqeY
MSLFEKISEDLKKAMLAKQKERLEPIRAIKTAFLLAKTEGGSHDLTAEQELKIIQKLIKQRRESADIFRAQNRMDLCRKEEEEASVIGEYLPEQISEEELIRILRDIILRVGAESPKDMGKVMGAASKELAGKADSRMIAEKVKALLGGS